MSLRRHGARTPAWVRGCAVLAIAVAGSATAAAPALAAPAGRIVQISTAGGKVSLVFTATGLAPGTGIDTSSIAVTVKGQPVSSTARLLSESAAKSDRVAVLTMDTSGSMQGAPLASAKDAAGTFLSSLPADVKVGLVTFADRASVAVQPTTDRGAVRSAIGGLNANGSTALYDATVLAAATAGTSGARNVVLFTDGQDEGSKATLAQATAAVKSSGAATNAVSLGTKATQLAPLRAITAAGKGTVVATNDAKALSTAFASQAAEISNQVGVVATLPSGVAGSSGTVAVTAKAGGATVNDSVFTSLAGAPAGGKAAAAPDYGPQPVAASSTRSALAAPWVIAVAILLLFIGLAALLALVLTAAGSGGSDSRRATRRLSMYTLSGKQAAQESTTSTALGSSGVAKSAVDFAGRVVTSRDFESVLAGRLERAAVPLKAPEWMLIHIGATLGLGLLMLLLFGGRPLPAIIGMVVGFILPWVYLSMKESRRQSAFLTQLPDTLQLVAGSLSSGYSLPQAVDVVTRESSQPISGEFNRALVEARLGVPLEDALDGIADRMGSVDFSWVVMAIRIQREVGGNLAEVLTTVAATLRERERLRRQVQVLSAEGRLSAWILGLLPILFTVYLILARPDYLRPLYTTLLGVILMVVGVVLMGSGLLWLRKVVKVEV